MNNVFHAINHVLINSLFFLFFFFVSLNVLVVVHVVGFFCCLFQVMSLWTNYSNFSIVTLDIDLNEAKRWHHLIPEECDTL